MPRSWMIVAGLLLVPLAASAAPKKAARATSPASKPAKRTATQSRALVDRILGEVSTRLWDHGDYYWHEGRYEDQAALCRLITRIDPGFVEAYSSGGWLYENLGRNDDALVVYLEGAKSVRNDWRPLHDLGYFYFQQKRYREALEILEKAVKLKPPSFVWHVLAHSYEKSGQRPEAIGIWKRCIELFPEDGAAKHNLRRLEPPDPMEAAAAGEPN